MRTDSDPAALAEPRVTSFTASVTVAAESTAEAERLAALKAATRRTIRNMVAAK